MLKDSPVALPKAIKNPTEIEGMKNANVSNASSDLHLQLFGQCINLATILSMKSFRLAILMAALSSQALVHELAKLDISSA